MLAALTSFLAASAAASFAPVKMAAKDAVPVDGSYIVVLREEATFAAGAKLEQALNATSSFHIGAFNGFVVDDLTIEDVESKIAVHSNIVEYVEQNTLMFALADQRFPPSWGLDRSDQESLPLDNLYRYPNSAGSGVDAYILDTGINLSHNDFGGRARFGFKASAGWSDGDVNGHGTHCAGTVAGTAHGIAKSAEVVTVKVLGDNGSGTTAGVIAGVDYTASNGRANRDVANMSLGGGASTALDDAVNAAVRSGVTMVVAAGNENQNSCNVSPGRARDAITVMSSDINDNRSSFSNWGTCAQIFAPGSAITSTWVGSNSATNTISGTSMAAPHVCGAAALIQGESSNSPASILSQLESAATVGAINNAGTGSPNLLLYV